MPSPSNARVKPLRRAYVLRLTWQAGRWQVTLQDVRGQEKLAFKTLAALLRYLQQLPHRSRLR